LAVAHLSEAPTSSASSSVTERLSPSGVSQLRWRSRPVTMRHGDRELSFLSIMATFGTPLDVTGAELAIESFFPADPGTGSALRDLHPPR
jgi:hypothetical protein